ncbi:hypothetical protein VT06_12150 [Arsukibacterium sp. MJ3]|uniref:hypothetical protein n=1 Tax=Arsukibacterium sp. MJ3 TaxID=1632859 RepID=UPI0006272E63|nr:hypothetical protein [Arsukibacterium sp. MJ3]KKO48287.1 hypothetical protein VT06_12150 [Arsukibacterium sp. MJ3]
MDRGVHYNLVGAGIAALVAGSMIAVLPLAAAVFVAIGVAYVLNEVDAKYGITRALIDRLEHVESEMKQDAVDGIYYLFLVTGKVVRRRLVSRTQQYINRLIRRFIQFPALR